MKVLGNLPRSNGTSVFFQQWADRVGTGPMPLKRLAHFLTSF